MEGAHPGMVAAAVVVVVIAVIRIILHNKFIYMYSNMDLQSHTYVHTYMYIIMYSHA